MTLYKSACKWHSKLIHELYLINTWTRLPDDTFYQDLPPRRSQTAPVLMPITPLVQTPVTNTGARLCCPTLSATGWGNMFPSHGCRLLGSISLTLEISPRLSYSETERTQKRVCTVQILAKLPTAVIPYFNTEQQEGTWLLNEKKQRPALVCMEGKKPAFLFKERIKVDISCMIILKQT